jgi:DNA gyrase subunit A
MDVVYPDAFLLTVTGSGFGKITPVGSYPRQHRAGSGVRTFKITENTGEVAAARLVSLSQQIMIISAEGIIIHTPVKDKTLKQGITIQGRSTQGVRLMRLDSGDKVAAITCFDLAG